ncbi:MAG: hypothetical protein KDA89_02465, partial [Planctomycetaceae bacterium]|nr:hypothetical protein [Planctomycetaceae bacterium]
MGAGGMQISFVGLLLLFLHAAATGIESRAVVGASSAGSADSAENQPSSPSTDAQPIHGFTGFSERFCSLTAFVFWAAAATGTVWFGLLPVLSGQQFDRISAAREAVGDREDALRATESAIAADPWNPKSRQRKLDLAAYLLSQAIGRSAQRRLSTARDSPASQGVNDVDSAFNLVRSGAEELLAADRFSANGYYVLSAAEWMVAVANSREDLKRSAADHLVRVVDRDPTDARLQAELADRFDRCGMKQEAVNVAGEALKIEAVNQSWGHSDQFLSEDMLRRVQEIAEGTIAD